MPEGDKGGVVGIQPIKTSAIQATQQLFHQLIVDNPKLTRDARKLAKFSRRKR